MSTHNPSNKKSNSLQVARYFWQHAKAYPLYLTGAVLSIPFTVLVSGILPALIIADVLSKLSQHHYEAHSIWASFGPELSLYVGLLFLGIAVWRIVDMFMWRLEMSIQQDIAEEVFRHMLGRSADFHANNFGGSLVSRTNKLLGGYVRVADTALYSTYPMLASIVLSIAILLSRAPLFAAILATFAVIYIAIAFAISRPVRELSTKFATAESAQTGLLADAISNVMTIKSFARSTFENQRFHAATHETRQRLSAFARMHQRQMGTLGVLNRTISGAALVSAVVAVMLFKANIGTVFLILSYTSTIVDQLFQFSNNGLRNYSRAFGDAGDMVATLAEPQEIQDPTQPEAPRINRGAILFEDVTFTHDGANDAIFEKLRLSIKPGEKIGLIGHSGSGK
ncbi:MAG TPA: ABC transporter ATP-binding protein, partial [Methylococcales bacterium]